MARTKRAAGSGLCNIGVATDDPNLPVAGTGRLSFVRKSKRSKWRAGVLVGVHTLVALHITHYLIAGRTLSPVEPSESMYTLELGYMNCGFIFFAIALVGTVIFGRFFCGWGCHIVALQDACAWMMKKLGVRPKPFRSRFLAFAPLAVAFYMFALPSLRRLVSGDARDTFPGFTNHLMTNNLWATFPGPVFGILTLAICGFAAVYFLGAKGFCTYGCPYGALFGGLDYASPGRIVVNDDCEQCGHCTATCTSNVRVHEEVRLYGMVVDPGCMKCMDCVSVCPKGALRFSFALPSVLKKAPATPRARRFDLPLSDELLVGFVGAAATLTFRDLYNGPPLLMSIGLGGITAFLSLKLWHLVRQQGVRIQNLELKASGRIRRSGWVVAILSVLWLAFTCHSAFAQWHRAWGRHDLNRTEVLRADGLSGAFRAATLSDRHERASAEAFRHFSWADRSGLVGVVEVKLGLAWCYVLKGDLTEAQRYARQALALAPDRPELRQNVADLERAAQPSPAERFALGELLASSGKLEEAAVEFEACVAAAPDSAPARFNLGSVLRRLGRNDAAIEQLQSVRRLAPDDPDVLVELGLAYMAAGSNREAIESFKRAVALNPESPESKLRLPGLIEQLEGRGGSGTNTR
jgi:tetratricopeptide (TPR) repeat protein/NAD-dependent dihydropyrimidine dehydrogenase PreA subunit